MSGQSKLAKTGRRVWYGGISENADKTVFNPEWGIKTDTYLTTTKYPSTAVIKKALGLYQTELRKPIHTVFCLDYSGSMYGEGIKKLIEAMDYILDEEKASQNLLQFSKNDKITIIPFNRQNIDVWTTPNGVQTQQLITNIKNLEVGGSTNIYDSSIEALQILSREDMNTYNVSVVLMTDGMSNYGNYSNLSKVYTSLGKDIPIYSIMFGDADSTQLESIAKLTNAKIFDGRTNLLEAFKQVRGFN